MGTGAADSLTFYLYYNTDIYTNALFSFEAVIQDIMVPAIYECTTCLTDGLGSPGVSPNVFFNFPSSNFSETINLLLGLGTQSSSFVYNGSTDNSMTAFTYTHYDPSAITEKTRFIDHINKLFKDDFEKDWTQVPIPTSWVLDVAHLTARLPILPIISAEMRLPRILRDPGESAEPFVLTSLEVKWTRAVWILVALMGGQLLMVTVVAFLTRKVPIREHDSYLTVARLMRTAMDTVEGGSMAAAEELAEIIQGKLGAHGIRYGTRMIDQGTRCVDLWEDVERKFPKDVKYD